MIYESERHTEQSFDGFLVRSSVMPERETCKSWRTDRGSRRPLRTFDVMFDCAGYLLDGEDKLFELGVLLHRLGITC